MRTIPSSAPRAAALSAALLTLVLPIAAAQKPSAAVQKPRPLDQSFDAQVDSVLKVWKVPGVAIGVVKGNQTLLLKGYGFKDLEAKAPVTPNTKFAIGSVSKSFTVTALAAQEAQGKFKWDKPVREYLPDFQLYDPVATEHMTPRDLVTHRSGLPRHDMIWGATQFTREDIYHRLRYLPPTRDFRSYWQYQNLMFMTAGYLSGKLNGTSWEEVVKERVFSPLGMTTADFSVNDLQRSPDFAYGYAMTPRDSQVVRTPYRVIDHIGPAGSINASASEMLRYLTMHLNQGKFEGREIIPAAQARQMQTAQMVMEAPGPESGRDWRELGAEQYGMGLFIGLYRGHKLVHHGGNIDGFSAELNFLPQDSLGVVVLTNMNGTSTRDFIPFLVYDRLLGLAPIDWSGRFKALAERGRARQDSVRAKEEATRKPNTRPSHAIATYAGVYSHPGYGDISISVEGDSLRLKYYSLELPLRHFHYDVFQTVPTSPVRQIRWRVNFATDIDGEIVSLAVPIEASLPALVFKREKEKERP